MKKPPLGNTERFQALKSQLSKRKPPEKSSALGKAVEKRPMKKGN